MRSLLRLCLCVLPAALTAQPASSSLWYESRIDQRRWVYPGQHDSTVPWEPSGERFRTVRRIGPPRPDARAYFVVPGVQSNVSVFVSSRGAIDSIDANLPTKAPDDEERDPVNSESWEFQRIDYALQLVPLFVRAMPSRGERITTPVRLRVHGAFNHWELTGRFVSRALRDSVTRSGVLRVIRDEGEFSWHISSSEYESTLGGVRRNERHVRGRWISVRVVDPTRGGTVSWTDSMRLAGMERDSLPDGRILRSPVRYERQRTSAMTDSATANRPQGMGRLRELLNSVPEAPFDLSSSRVIDSLVRGHRRERTQAARDSIERWLIQRSPPLQASGLAANYLAMGDTARAVMTLSHAGSDPFDATAYAILRPFLDDPQRALRFGLSMDEYYEMLEDGVTSSPPAVAHDSLQTFCVPSLCGRIAEERTRAHEPRLRDIGLLAAAAQRPREWGDTLIALSKAGHPMLQGLARQLIGSSAPSDSMPALPFPSIAQDWRVWLAWMRTANPTRPRQNPNDIRAWVDRIDSRSIQLAMLYRGDAYRDSIASRFARADADTVRYVYGRLLQALGMQRDGATLLQVIESGTPLDIELASNEAWRLPFVSADSVTASLLQSQMLDRYAGQPPVWRLAALPMRFPDWTDGIRLERFQTWSGEVQPYADARLRTLGLRPLAPNAPASDTYTNVIIEPVLRAGPFATVGIRFPEHAAHYLLVLVRGEWKLLAVVSSVV